MASVKPSHYRLTQAAQQIALGGVIAYPTEAVWGLGCDPANERALRQLLALKQRDPAKGLILVAASVDQFAPLLQGLSKTQRQQLDDTWPGHFTWLVPHRGLVHPLVSGEFDTVALRVSAQPVVNALCKVVGGPVVSTSANPQGKDPALDGAGVRQYFGGRLDYILDGKLGFDDQGIAAAPSEIRDLATGKVIRPGQ